MFVFVVARSAPAVADPSDAATENASSNDETGGESDDAGEPEPPSSKGFVIDAPSGPSFGLEAQAGLALEWMSGRQQPHAIYGGLARLAFHDIQAGVSFDASDASQARDLLEAPVEHWSAIGGFVGARVPYRHWIDVDAAIGVESRHYRNPDPIYGANGFDLASTALTFRIGASDRGGEKLFGPRLGAALVVAGDLNHHSPTWTRTYSLEGGGFGHTSGTTPIGGVSVALVVVVGLDVGGGARRRD
ncbi:MAG TPA: hypothetical protein VH142_24305 [Polyangiaceae bacterium]|nr:hypothetical protein [Polyangiaceae bacterium]